MKPLYKSTLFTLGALLMAGCSDSDSWKPGPQPEKDTLGVFFPAQAKYEYTIEADDSRLLPVTISRCVDDEAATVPLTIVSLPEGVTVPESITFDAGVSTTTFNIDCTGMASRTSGNVDLLLGADYTNPYAAGSPTLQFKVTVTGAWIPLAENVRVTYNNNRFAESTTTLYVLDGTSQFKLPNFLNSGLDLKFTVAEPTTATTNIIPLSNYVTYAELFPEDPDDYECWYLYDESTGYYPVWSPDGTEPIIEYAMFYGVGYSYLSLNDGKASFCMSAEMSDGTSEWIYANLYFDAFFNPFE